MMEVDISLKKKVRNSKNIKLTRGRKNSNANQRLFAWEAIAGWRKCEEMSKLRTNLRIRETEDGEDHIDIAKRRLHENLGIGEKLMVKGRPERVVEREMDPEDSIRTLKGCQSSRMGQRRGKLEPRGELEQRWS